MAIIRNEDSDRMPLVISYPGQKTKGQITNSIVEMIDFYPTLSELAGLSYPEYVAGKSIVPILKMQVLLFGKMLSCRLQMNI